MPRHNQQIHSGGGDCQDGSAEDPALGAGQAQLKTTGTDDLLEEIDGLLENNAEEFVRHYVQKGGQ